MKNRYLRILLIILIALFLVFTVIFLIDYIRNRQIKVVEPKAPEVKLAWNFPVDSIHIDSLKVKQNQCLSDILTDQGVSLTAIDQLARNSSGIFDVRRIKAGNNYYIISNKTTNKRTHFIYEETVSDYYTFSLSDSFAIKKGIKDIDTLRCTFTGTIESSLWNSFIDQGANPNLCIALSDIFAWTVDFFGVQRGDRFKVVYDEYSVDGKFAGIGKIHTALFESSGEEVPAYYFEHNGQIGYFDDKGNSLRKAFLKAPLNFSRISSRYSASRFHPVLKIRRPHYGVDYAAPTGTPVYSIGDGVITQKSYQAAGGGNYLTIKHNSVYSSQYMHLSKFAQGITAGTRVKQGQLIGFVGMTGLASGPHLDFRIFMNGSAVDPLKVKTPPVEPIQESNKALFAQVKDSLNKILEAIPYHKDIASN